jgi:putative ABC transport system permease protein
LVASVRTVVQLLLIGMILQWIWHAQWPAVLAVMLIMSSIAGLSAVRRNKRRYPGIWLNSLTAVMASSWIIIAITLTAIIQPEVWRGNLAQYAIPLLGMILGNTMNGISLGLDRFSEELTNKRSQVEMLLTLGASRWEAAVEAVREAIRTGMIPIINSMMVVGVVSLPGMMTGQILAGADPAAAVKYQIMIMFLIASGTALGTVGAVLLSYLRLFNRRHQFLFEQIHTVKQ